LNAQVLSSNRKSKIENRKSKMISLTCTSCKKVLEIDDAFAGGVCRCRHCGTIQTVPSTLKRGARPGAPVTPVTPVAAKTLYQKKPGSPTSPTTAGSAAGTASPDASAQGGNPPVTPTITRAAAPTLARKPHKLRPAIVAGIAVVGAILAALVIYFLWATFIAPAPSATAPTTIPSGPHFGDIALDGSSVIYLIDRADGTKPIFGDLKELTLKSIASLGPDRQFQILFWSNGEESAYPGPDMVKATSANVTAARRALDAVYAFGQTNIQPSLQRAVEQKPAAIVIATANGWDLNDSFVTMVTQLAGDSHIQLHCLTIGAGQSSKPLETVAKQSGGQFREVTEDQLRSYAQ
jgi:hypothetical protein